MQICRFDVMCEIYAIDRTTCYIALLMVLKLLDAIMRLIPKLENVICLKFDSQRVILKSSKAHVFSRKFKHLIEKLPFPFFLLKTIRTAVSATSR